LAMRSFALDRRLEGFQKYFASSTERL